MVPIYYYISLSLRAGVLASPTSSTRNGPRYGETVRMNW
jgi:hypothetical protein